MTFKFCASIFLTPLLCCNRQDTNLTDTFIVPKDTFPVYKTVGNQPPPPPPIKRYYYPSNFIIDTGEHIYYYQQKAPTGWYCGTGLEWNTPPSFIDLVPKDIVQLPNDNLDEFIKLNIRYVDKLDRTVAITSTIDTVKSTGLALIFKTFRTNDIDWIFRRATQEENIVPDYKKRQATYYFNEIKWDSIKILFPTPPSKLLTDSGS